ncbi:hypothetical protein KEM52_001519, partial [Ascosphaera acerosa]
STERDVYTAARRRAGIAQPSGMEVLLYNHDGQVMEGSVCSVYIRRPIAVAQQSQSQPVAGQQSGGGAWKAGVAPACNVGTGTGNGNGSPAGAYVSPELQSGNPIPASDARSGGSNDADGPSHITPLLLDQAAQLTPSAQQPQPQPQHRPHHADSDDHSPMPQRLAATAAGHVASDSAPLSARDMWVTPPLSTGCNASTTRAYALAQGMCREEAVSVASIVDGEEIWLSNGLRGFVPGVVRLDRGE